MLFFPGENQFEILSKDAFKNLGKVTKLYVLNNQIEMIPSRVFEDLHSLIELSLGMNIDNLLRLFMVVGSTLIRPQQYQTHEKRQFSKLEKTQIALFVFKPN